MVRFLQIYNIFKRHSGLKDNNRIMNNFYNCSLLLSSEILLVIVGLLFVQNHNQVIVGAHAVMANGGVLAPVGMHMVALAARRHAVPFVVLAGVHKVCQLL
jgi:hypothetical protein